MATLKKKLIPTAIQIHEMLQQRFAAPAYAYLQEVGNSTGYGCMRHADALAVSLWPSRGLHISGFEIKCSYSDWKRELQNPSKSEPIQKYCDYWWVVTATENMVKLGELPETWGLMVVDTKGKLTCIKEAPKLTPVPVDINFMAAIFRQMHDNQKHMISEAKMVGYNEAIDKGPEEYQHKEKQFQRRIESLELCIKKFEEKSGVKINNEWAVGDIGEAVRKIVRYYHMDGPLEALQAAQNRLKSFAEDINKSIDHELDVIVEILKLKEERNAQVDGSVPAQQVLP